MNLKLEDLYVQCSECEGTGRYEGPPKSDSSNQSASSHHVHTSGNCPKCKGARGEFTSTGETLLQFIQVLKRQGKI